MAVVSANKKRNASWPLRRGAKGWNRVALGERYSAALRHLLRTKHGALLWAPTYGVRIEFLRTQGLNMEHVGFVETEIKQAIATWIPDMHTLGIDITSNPDDERLDITIVWALPASVSVAGRAPEDEFAFGPVQTTVTV
jgi:phage baseplate assembly protein W